MLRPNMSKSEVLSWPRGQDSPNNKYRVPMHWVDIWPGLKNHRGSQSHKNSNSTHLGVSWDGKANQVQFRHLVNPTSHYRCTVSFLIWITLRPQTGHATKTRIKKCLGSCDTGKHPSSIFFPFFETRDTVSWKIWVISPSIKITSEIIPKTEAQEQMDVALGEAQIRLSDALKRAERAEVGELWRLVDFCIVFRWKAWGVRELRAVMWQDARHSRVQAESKQLRKFLQESNTRIWAWAFLVENRHVFHE